MRTIFSLAIATALLASPAAIVSGSFSNAEAQAREIPRDNTYYTISCPNGVRNKCKIVAAKR